MHAIRWFNCTAPAALALIFLLHPTAYIGAQSGPLGPNSLSFLLAVGVQVGNDPEAKPVALENHAVLSTGDRIKFFLEPQTDAHFYLFHLGPNGVLSPLFPLDWNEVRVPAGRQVYVPEGALWFELDAASGMEKFFLLVSKERLAQLENLAARHAAFKDRTAAESSAKAVLDEISRLNKHRRPLAAPAEKPVRIAGKFRAPSKLDSAALPDITPFAKEIVAQGYYNKTITVDHR
jgi:hypothetical protein